MHILCGIVLVNGAQTGGVCKIKVFTPKCEATRERHTNTQDTHVGGHKTNSHTHTHKTHTTTHTHKTHTKHTLHIHTTVHAPVHLPEVLIDGQPCTRCLPPLFVTHKEPCRQSYKSLGSFSSLLLTQCSRAWCHFGFFSLIAQHTAGQEGTRLSTHNFQPLDVYLTAPPCI